MISSHKSKVFQDISQTFMKQRRIVLWLSGPGNWSCKRFVVQSLQRQLKFVMLNNPYYYEQIL